MLKKIVELALLRLEERFQIVFPFAPTMSIALRVANKSQVFAQIAVATATTNGKATIAAFAHRIIF